MRFYIADAFTNELFGGNPAGIVILDPELINFPDEKIMIKVAAELRYSETAFIRQISKDEFQIRYFTPVSEVDLCGHATICSAFCLIDHGLITGSNETTCIVQTRAGNLVIQIKDEIAMMQMGEVELGAKISSNEELSELASIMGIKSSDIGLSDIYRKVQAGNLIHSASLLPRLVSTGLFDILLPLKSKSALMGISPDYPALSRLSEKYNVVGVHAFYLDCSDDILTNQDKKIPLAYCRNFAPLYGIDEESATGTANGALIAYLHDENLVDSNMVYKISQGESMNRPSEIFARVEADFKPSIAGFNEKKPPIIKIGGKAKIVAKGEIYI